jgi:FkbM family methyltransferase
MELGPFWRGVRTRAARRLGFELKPILPPGEACMVRMAELRGAIGLSEPEDRPFLQFCLENLTRSNADILQDLFVLFHTGGKRDGFFVEFGAADGMQGSNTWLLEREFGWRGILAEPARCWHEALDSARACAIDHRCVTDRSGDTVSFRECANAAVSTIDSYAGNDRFAAWRRKGVRYPVATVSLNDLLAGHGAPAEFDYLSIDTEGSELMILSGLDFERHRPRIVTVEHCQSAAREPLFAQLTGQGYLRVHPALSQVDDWYVLDRGA